MTCSAFAVDAENNVMDAIEGNTYAVTGFAAAYAERAARRGETITIRIEPSVCDHDWHTCFIAGEKGWYCKQCGEETTADPITSHRDTEGKAQ